VWEQGTRLPSTAALSLASRTLSEWNIVGVARIPPHTHRKPTAGTSTELHTHSVRSVSIGMRRTNRVCVVVSSAMRISFSMLWAMLSAALLIFSMPTRVSMSRLTLSTCGMCHACVHWKEASEHTPLHSELTFVAVRMCYMCVCMCVCIRLAW
jgi:hypothetical protein